MSNWLRWRYLSPDEGGDGGGAEDVGGVEVDGGDVQPISAFLPEDWTDNQRAEYAKTYAGDDGMKKALLALHESQRTLTSRFGKAGKVPDSSDQYQFEGGDEGKLFADTLKPVAHELGIGQEQFTGVAKIAESYLSQQKEKLNEVLSEHREKMEAQAKERLGDRYDEVRGHIEEQVQKLEPEYREVMEIMGLTNSKHIEGALMAVAKLTGDDKIPDPTPQPKVPAVSEKDANYQLEEALKQQMEIQKSVGGGEELTGEAKRKNDELTEKIENLGRIIAAHQEA